MWADHGTGVRKIVHASGRGDQGLRYGALLLLVTVVAVTNVDDGYRDFNVFPPANRLDAGTSCLSSLPCPIWQTHPYPLSLICTTICIPTLKTTNLTVSQPSTRSARTATDVG